MHQGGVIAPGHVLNWSDPIMMLIPKKIKDIWSSELRWNELKLHPRDKPAAAVSRCAQRTVGPFRVRSAPGPPAPAPALAAGHCAAHSWPLLN